MVPAKVKFVGTTPCLGPLRRDLDGIDFEGAGPESWPKAREMKDEWLEDPRRDCAAQNIPLLTKVSFE